MFGLKDLSSSSILRAFRLFRADAGSYARCFRSDCDTKLFGTTIRDHLIDNASNIVAAAAGRQSSNGLVESHWKVMVHIARAYLTEKQMPRLFWFYAIVHSARMMNAIPGKFGGKLASPFLLVHGSGHDERTWFPLFSVCYFHHVRDGDIPRSHCQLHTLDGIAIGRSPMSNALLVYNPRTKRYYEPDSYRLDPYRLHLWFILPSSMMVVSFALSFGTRMCRRKNPFLRAPVSSVWTRPLTCFSRVR